jgi:MFS family permease
MYFAMFSMFFFITLYLQRVLHEDALQAGLAFLPMTLAVFTGSSLAPRLVAQAGLRKVVASGMLLTTVGLALFTGVRPGGSYFALVLPGAVVSGLGMGLGLVGSTIAATQGVARAQSGLASGLVNMSRLFGGALGLAVLSTVAASASHAPSGASPLQKLTDGYGLAFAIGASVTMAGALVALGFLRARPVAQVVTVAERRETREARESEPERVAA